MKNKLIVAFVITLLLTSTLTIVSAEISEELQDDIEESIDKGIAYIASQQLPDGSFLYGNHAYDAAYTGFALIKLQDYAYEKGFDPFDESYEYYSNVSAGYEYLWTVAHEIPIGMQTSGNPDTDENGYGIAFGSDSHRWTYTTGIVLMALESSRAPDRASGLDFDGDSVPDSFFDVAQNAVDWLLNAQGDPEHGVHNGGWWYSGTALGVPSISSTGGLGSDNSNTGFAVLGLAAAEAWGISIPQWVKDAHSLWIDVIQDDSGGYYNGGSWYTPYSTLYINEYKTGNLLFEMTFVGDTPETQRFQDAMDFIERFWHNPNPYYGWGIGGGKSYIAMYTLMKGFEYSGVETVDLSSYGGSADHDWYEQFATEIVAEQYSDGSWRGGAWGSPLLDTCWALLVLEKISPPPPLVEVSVDVKPGSWPNPFVKGAKGVFSVAICGTEDFDVTTIDPDTVKMYFNEVVEEGDCAAPVRWNYEDVATPYSTPNATHPEGWAGHADGYVDLVFKFSREEVTALMTCEEEDMSYWKLYLTGNLKEEAGGTALEGFDWIRVQIKGNEGGGKGKGKGK